MTRNEVIEEIARDKQYKVICRKIASDKVLGDDLYSEVILSLIENKNIVNIRIQCGDYFYLYVIKCAYNMYRHKRDAFCKKYKDERILLTDVFPEQIDESINLNIDELFNDVSEELMNIVDDYGSRYPYEVKMFEAYLEQKTLRNLSKATGIPVISCHTAISKIKSRINDRIKLSDYYSDSSDI